MFSASEIKLGITHTPISFCPHTVFFPPHHFWILFSWFQRGTRSHWEDGFSSSQLSKCCMVALKFWSNDCEGYRRLLNRLLIESKKQIHLLFLEQCPNKPNECTTLTQLLKAAQVLHNARKIFKQLQLRVVLTKSPKYKSNQPNSKVFIDVCVFRREGNFRRNSWSFLLLNLISKQVDDFQRMDLRAVVCKS